jgi:hypothetical protein
MDILNKTYSIQILIGSEDKREKLRIYLLQGQQGIKKRITSIGNNMNSPIRTSAIRLLQHLQLLYLPSELDIDEQIQQVTLYFYCMQYQYHPVIPTLPLRREPSPATTGRAQAREVGDFLGTLL